MYISNMVAYSILRWIRRDVDTKFLLMGSSLGVIFHVLGKKCVENCGNMKSIGHEEGVNQEQNWSSRK